MGIKSRLTEMVMNSGLGKEIQEKVASDVIQKQTEEVAWRIKRIKEGSTASSSRASSERADLGWRRITTADVKDLTPMDQDKMLKICFYLYDKNGMGHRMVERYTDFVVGDGVTWDITDSAVNEVWDEHWVLNNWEIYQYQIMRELSIYGEQVPTTFINSETGRVKLGYLDPTQVTEVKTDPENVKKKTEVIYVTTKDLTGKPKTIIDLDENANSKTFGYLVGETFYFSINNVTNQPRGRSDLFPQADAIDSYENFLFNVADRADILTRIIYDLELHGRSQSQIDDILEDFKIPRSDELYGHNEKSKLTITVPKMGSEDLSSTGKQLKNHFLSGAGFPPHWFAEGEGLTRATATSMDLPTKKQLKTRQRYFRWMLQYIYTYTKHQAIIKKRLTADKKDVKMKINLPKIEEKELAVVATALVNVTNSLVVATEQDWITDNTAKKVYANVLSNVGLEIETMKSEEAKENQDEAKVKELYKKKLAKELKKKEEESEDA